MEAHYMPKMCYLCTKSQDMSKVKALYHIVINTKNRKMTISEEHCDDLYRYVAKILRDNQSIVYRVNGIANHIHLLIDLHPSKSLSAVIQEAKRASSVWAKSSGLFPMFEGWGKEFGAFSVSDSHRDVVTQYIVDQKRHHKTVCFENELQRIYERNGVDWNEVYLT